MSALAFTVGARVRLTKAGGLYYGAVALNGEPRWPRFAYVPVDQGAGKDGTVLFAGERPHKPGADPRPYYVRWDNGAENSYREVDLELAPTAPEFSPLVPEGDL